MLNNFMKQEHPIQSIYEELLELRIVQNQTDFSIMCGRTAAWFSCLKARDLPITADAALTLAHKLRRKAGTTICSDTHHRLNKLSEKLLLVTEAQVAKKVAFTDNWEKENESI